MKKVAEAFLAESQRTKESVRKIIVDQQLIPPEALRAVDLFQKLVHRFGEKEKDSVKPYPQASQKDFGSLLQDAIGIVIADRVKQEPKVRTGYAEDTKSSRKTIES